MKIEKLEVSQHLDTRKLYEEVFSKDEKSFVDYYYQEKTKDNIIYVVRENDDIQAMLHLNPYTLMVNGIEKESYYIVAVATRKEYRGRRYMAGLLREALLDMYQAGVTFTYLMPAAEAIYLPHDFRTMLRRRNWRKVLLYRRLKIKIVMKFQPGHRKNWRGNTRFTLSVIRIIMNGY